MGGGRPQPGPVRHRRRSLVRAMEGAGFGSERGMLDLARSVAHGVRWWFASLMGDNAYVRYVEHLALHHPGQPPPTEREYWRAKYAEADLHPGARCC